jgi:RNA polymerase sigma factor (sigma-70 family)
MATIALSTQTTPESILWDQFRKGNEDAFTKIYEQFSDELFKYGLHLCGNENMVQDCMHDLFVYIYSKRANLGATTSIKYYLLRSLKREISKASLKSKKTVHKEDMSTATHHYNFEISLSPESIFLTKEGNRHTTLQLQTAVNELPRSQREIIYLVYYSGLSYEQVAEILQLTIRTVYNQVYNAIQKLKEVVTVRN